MIGSLEELSAELTADGMQHKTDLAREQIVMTMEIAESTTATVLMWPKNSPLIQALVILPFKVKGERSAALMEAVTRLNHALMVPGFGLDLDNSQAYYRAYQPKGPTAEVPIEQVKQMFATAINMSERFAPLLRAVNAGELEPKDVVIAA